MSYCTQSDIVEQLPENDLIGLTDDNGAGVVDTNIVGRAIADADATIDAYCQGRYTVPLATAPAKVRAISVDLAIYNLFARRSLEAPEIRSYRNREAIRFLERVADGRIDLGAASPAPTTSGNEVSVSSNDRIFTRTKMAGL